MADPVLIAGGGIGGLVTALTLHQIGVPCRVFEAVTELKPLGVGINIQPNAVRELFDLGIGAEALDAVGIATREWVLVGLNGAEIYAEARGREAGYDSWAIMEYGGPHNAETMSAAASSTREIVEG